MTKRRMIMTIDNDKVITTFVDDCGVEHHISDFAPSPEDELPEGVCVCGETNCADEYAHTTSGY